MKRTAMMMSWRMSRKWWLSRKGIADVASEKKKTASHKRPEPDAVLAAADITPSASDPFHKRLVHRRPAAAMPPIGKCPAKRPAAAADKFNLVIWMELRLAEEAASGSASKGNFKSKVDHRVRRVAKHYGMSKAEVQGIAKRVRDHADAMYDSWFS